MLQSELNAISCIIAIISFAIPVITYSMNLKKPDTRQGNFWQSIECTIQTQM